MNQKNKIKIELKRNIQSAKADRKAFADETLAVVKK